MPPAVCVDCEAEILDCAILRVEEFHNNKVFIVFEYENFVRELIVRAKIKNDIVAVGFIIKFLGQCAHEKISEFDLPSTLVIPAPPSFWGRMRGRFDLAQLASLTLFPHADVYTGALPGTLFRPKRAGRNLKLPNKSMVKPHAFISFNRTKEMDRLLSRISRAKRVLLVDDVMTTGFTMKALIDQLKMLGAQSVDGLVLASSACNDSDLLNDEIGEDLVEELADELDDELGDDLEHILETL